MAGWRIKQFLWVVAESVRDVCQPMHIVWRRGHRGLHDWFVCWGWFDCTISPNKTRLRCAVCNCFKWIDDGHQFSDGNAHYEACPLPSNARNRRCLWRDLLSRYSISRYIFLRNFKLVEILVSFRTAYLCCFFFVTVNEVINILDHLPWFPDSCLDTQRDNDMPMPILDHPWTIWFILYLKAVESVSRSHLSPNIVEFVTIWVA